MRAAKNFSELMDEIKIFRSHMDEKFSDLKTDLDAIKSSTYGYRMNIGLVGITTIAAVIAAQVML